MYNKIVAFSIGEMLNDDTAIIHFEKSDPTIRGLYQVINHEFVVHAWPHTTYINREEDMGIPGLRHSKESYNRRKIRRHTAPEIRGPFYALPFSD